MKPQKRYEGPLDYDIKITLELTRGEVIRLLNTLLNDPECEHTYSLSSVAEKLEERLQAGDIDEDEATLEAIRGRLQRNT